MKATLAFAGVVRLVFKLIVLAAKCGISIGRKGL